MRESLQNPGYPSTTSDTGSVTYTIDKCQCDVCWLRLDFDTFNIQGTTDSLETDGVANSVVGGGVCLDDLTITVGNAVVAVPFTVQSDTSG